MAKKQYLDLAGLTTYDEQIKSYIDAGDAATSTKLTNGSIVVKEAQHATSADSATNASNAANADKLGGQSPSYYAKASDIPTGALADKDVVSESDLDAALAEKVNAASEGNHSHSNKSVLDNRHPLSNHSFFSTSIYKPINFVSAPILMRSFPFIGNSLIEVESSVFKTSLISFML